MRRVRARLRRLGEPEALSPVLAALGVVLLAVGAGLAFGVAAGLAVGGAGAIYAHREVDAGALSPIGSGVPDFPPEVESER